MGTAVLRNEYEKDLSSSEHYLTISENKAWKVWIWIHELCNTGAVLYQPSYYMYGNQRLTFASKSAQNTQFLKDITVLSYLSVELPL